MSLTSLIRFRNLDSILTDTEFYNKFIGSIERKVIVRSLFNYFQTNPNAISPVTTIQSSIINAREATAQSSKCISFDKLPSELISECGSYLKYKQYFRLAMCNRATYIGCYASPKIQTFDLSHFQGTTTLPFKNVKKLIMEIKDFNHLSKSNRSIWNRKNSLNELMLNNINGTEKDIESFIDNQQSINCENVKKLSIINFQVAGSINMCEILSQFPQIHTLYVSCTNLTSTSIDTNQIKKWFSNLKEFDCGAYGNIQFNDDIINVLHNQLELINVDDESITINKAFPKLKSLTLMHPMVLNTLVPQNQVFPELQSLILGSTDGDPVNLELFENLKTLQNGKVELFETFDDEEMSTSEMMNQCINWFMTTSNKLEHFEISTALYSMDSFSIMQTIETALIRNVNHERNCGTNFTVSVSFQMVDCDYLIGKQTLRIINALESNDINWCLRIYHPYLMEEDELYFDDKLNDMKANYHVEYEPNYCVFDRGGSCKFTIQSKNFNGCLQPSFY